VHDDQEGRTSDKDELQGPEADVGDGEEVIVTHIGAARLPRVAVKVLLLVTPDPLGCHHVDQHAEHKDHGEPDAAEGCGVLVDAAEQRLRVIFTTLWAVNVCPGEGIHRTPGHSHF
uniref:Uncharacterized protein n=1 Tax=Catharus ustulatus TaxID=91951 RepID=A0A8C3UA16_CATUS